MQLIGGKIIRDISYSGLSRYFALFLGICRGFLVPKLLDPSGYGIWKGISIISDYSRLPQLGTTSALFREIPLLKSQNRSDELKDVVDTCYTVNTLNAAIVSVLVLLGSFFVSTQQESNALRLYSILILLSENFMFMKIYFSGHKEFVFLSKINATDAVVSLILVVGLSWFFGLNGLIIGIILEMLIILAMFYRELAVKPVFRIHFDVWPTLIRTGFPIMMTGILLQLLLSVDKIMVLTYFGAKHMGFYALGFTIMGMIYQAFSVVDSVISPHLIEKYGKTESIDSIEKYVSKPLIAAAFISPLLLFPLLFFSKLVYFKFLSDYLPGYESFRIMLMTGYFVILSNTLNSFFIAIKKQKQVVFIQLLAILLIVISNYMAIKLIHSLDSVAMSTAIVTALYAVTTIIYAKSHYFKDILSHMGFVGLILFPIAYSMVLYNAIVYCLSSLPLVASGVIEPFICTTGFVMLYLPAAFLGSRLVRINL